jgi:CHASE2 domain-containing sensor protein
VRRLRPALTPKTAAVLVAAVLAVGGGAVSYALNAWPRLENDTIDMRFGVRGAERTPPGVVVVAIDDRTFSDLKRQWPFPREYDARVISQLHADGARAIAYDVQFTEPTDPVDDMKLFSAVARAGHVVLATTTVNAAGQTDVLGGDTNLRQAHAVAAAANLPADAGGVIRRYPETMLGLPSFAVAAVHAAGHSVPPTRFHHDSALIDFRGPPGTIPTVSFSDVYAGRVNPRVFAGKIVVVGASAPTLQDMHPTSTTGAAPMAGAEVQANAIWTALHANPLQPAPDWWTLAAILLGACLAPVASLRLRPLGSTLVAVGAAIAYLALAQVAFDAGTVLVVSYPLAGWALGTIGMIAASYVGAFAERNAFSRRLQESQLELIQRLAQAVDSRDRETGEHVHRIGLLCRRLAVHIGWSPADAETLMHASVAHDIGKIAIPDTILLKEGPLDAGEWQTMKTHTTIGGRLLAGSNNPLVQMAQTIALSHHERWDGTGYPAGLSGEDIPLVGRICAVVDVYDALLSKRPYKEAWLVQDALAEIQRNRGTHFDPRLVDAFLEFAPSLDEELQSSFMRESTIAARRPAFV